MQHLGVLINDKRGACSHASQQPSGDGHAPEFMMVAARMPVAAHPAIGASTVFGAPDAIALCMPTFHPNHRQV